MQLAIELPAERFAANVASFVPALVGPRAKAFYGSMTNGVARSRDLDPETQKLLMLAIARDRSKEAFGDLFQHFAPRVKAYLVRLGAGDGMAEELSQEAMIAVWAKAQQFDPSQASVSTWIFTIARNKRIDALRREKRPELDPSDPVLAPEGQPAADRVVESAQMETRIRDALRTLPPEQARVIEMAFFEDKAHGAIAEETKLPLGTVKSRLRLAMARLRKALQAEGVGGI